MKLLFFIIVLILVRISPAFAQEFAEQSKPSDPFEVIEIQSHWISIDSVCRILYDSDTKIMADIIIADRYRFIYRYRGSWFECEIAHEGPYGAIDYGVTYTTADIDYDGMNELLIESDFALYGSGGGTVDYRAAIYKFDTIVRKIFDGDIGSAEEMFGRDYNNGANYFLLCKHEIIFKRGEFRILPVSDVGSWIHGIRRKIDKCSNYVKPGKYEFLDGQLKVKPPAKKKKTLK